ncbi:MAG TPA: ferritin family protein [Terriglobales bacterium]|jgi:rubrerythrin
MQRSFSSLTAAEALRVAISIEQRNADVYHRFAEMFTQFGDEESLEIASVFWEMAVEEQGHRSLLEEKYVQAFGPLGGKLTEQDMIELVEVPQLESADLFAVSDEFSPRDRALQVAVQAEVSAQQFYERLAGQTPEGPLRQMFRDLARMEDGHVSYLESKRVNDAAESHTIQ